MDIYIAPPIAPAQTHAVFVVIPRFNITTLITMIETMRVANYLAPAPMFSWDVVSFDGTKIAASNGMTATVNAASDAVRPAEFAFVLGSWGTEHYANTQLTAWLRKRARAGTRICGVELGCYIVARAGLLEDKAVSIHWSWLNGFRETFDHIDVREDLFTLDRRVMTCAGGLAGVDLMLRLIEDLHGGSLSTEVADQILHHPVRGATSPQRSATGRSTETLLPLVREAMTLIENNIEDPLTVPDIARKLDVSQRQLERQFKKHVGCTVVQFGLLRRLQNARLLLISTQLSIRQVATASGFNTLSHFAYAFGKMFGRRPSEYRDAWPVDQPAPTWPGTLSDFLNMRAAAPKTRQR